MYVSQIQWHPSGHYLAVNLDYRDEVAFYEVQRIPETRGTVTVIQLAELNTPGEQVQHRVVSTAIADLSPESLAIATTICRLAVTIFCFPRSP